MNYTISDKESRLINVIKLFSIVLVLYIHSFSGIEYGFQNNNFLFNSIQMIEYVIAQVIARAGVPLFFLISSLLLYRKNFTFKENLKKKVKRILIPYIIVNTIWIIIFAVFQNIEFFKVFFNNEENNIKNWNVADWIDAYIPMFNRVKPFVYPLWFLKDLFLLNIFSIIIKKIIDKFPKLYFILIVGIWLLNINLGIIEAQSLLFFSIGYYIVKYNIRFNKLNKINLSILSIIYFIAAFIIAYIEILYKEVFVIHNIVIIVSMCYLYLLANKCISLSENTIGKKLIENSYFIYLFHEWNMLFIRKILDKLIMNNYIIDFVKYFCLPLIIIILCLCVSKIWKRISKETYKIVMGE